MEQRKDRSRIPEKQELELYIHIPFCEKKCDYCDFLSSPSNEAVKKRYFDALSAEIRSYEGRTKDYLVSTIFIGGGTPSCVDAVYIKKLLDEVRRVFSLSEEEAVPRFPEITIEVNPGTLDQKKLTIYKEAGINRISFGLQSTVEKELKLLGRIHDYSQFLENYKLARRMGFVNINVDLMSALPGQTLKSWELTLDRIAKLEPEHISAYSLIIEEGTPFFERYGEGRQAADALPGEEEDRLIYARTKERLKEYGYHRYEISNYSRAGYECRHNLGYWKGTAYLGLGLGASSLIRHTRFHNVSNMPEYLDLCNWWCKNKINAQQEQGGIIDDDIRKDRLGIRRDVEPLNISGQMEEFMFLGLRVTDGISKEEFYRRFGRTLSEVYGSALGRLMKQGLMTEEENYYRLTDYGIDISNMVLSEFLLN